jgi:hypothetical protein
MQRTHPGMWPVVRLRTGSFRHKDARIGLVITPVLLVVGNMAQNTTAAPDTSMASIISDELPLEGGGDALNDPLPPME